MKWTSVAVLLGLTALPPICSAQEPFRWNGRITEGSTVRVHSQNGPIDIVGTAGPELRVEGTITSRSRDAEPMRFEVVESDAGVVICAITDSHLCEEDGIRQAERRPGPKGTERAELRVELPVGVHLVAATGNGRIRVDDTASDVRAASGNGDIEIEGSVGRVTASTGNGTVSISDAGGPVTARTGNGWIRVRTAVGPVEAQTGNGDIDVVMDRLGEGDLEFTTGNGRVVVETTDDFDADLRIQLGNGTLDSDFPLLLSGRTDFRNLRATIGDGGRRLIIRSGSGDALLRRGSAVR